jgi:hypothetical protein
VVERLAALFFFDLALAVFLLGVLVAMITAQWISEVDASVYYKKLIIQYDYVHDSEHRRD